MKRPPLAAAPLSGAKQIDAASPRISGDWSLGRLLARGLRADVYEARPASSADDKPCEYVAKLLPESQAGDSHAQEMFRREVCVGGKVCHEHLVPVVDAGPDQQARFLVMPRVEGTTVQELLVTFGRLEWDRAIWIIRQLAQALACLHDEGWLHGDVKPANALVSSDGHVTLLDLGLLQLLHEREPTSTDAASLMGTPRYMAPEVINGRCQPVAASDIYSLGMMLYEMLAGHHPFETATPTELVRLHREVMPPDISSHDAALPMPLVELTRAMIAKDPLRRPATAQEIVGRLVSLEFRALQQVA